MRTQRAAWLLLALAPARTLAALHGGRGDTARQQRLAILDRVAALVDRAGVGAGVHPDGVARAGLDAEPTDHAAELVDLEARGALLDALLVALLGDDRDAVRR